MGKLNRDDYRFLKIVDAMSALNQKVNLIGIIVEYGTPNRSKGTDWFVSLRIVDETHHDRGFLVNVFAESQGKLPKVETSGDIIQLSHVMMKTHNAETYALFNKSYSSFALYEGKYGDNCKPYQASLKFRQRDQDKAFVVGLRKWVEGVQLGTAAKDSVMLRQLKEGQCFDLVCKILHVSEVNKDEWMLFIWDGTDVPPLQLQSKLDDEIKNPLPLQVEPQSLPRNILCSFPTVGTTLRVSVQHKNANLIIPSLTTGRWVKFINMTFNVQGGLWCGVLTQETKLRFVPSDDSYILERQRDYEERFSSKLNRMPFTSFPWPSRITEVDRKVEDVPLVTLMDILTYTQVTAKFKCIVRVVAALPSKVEDLRSPAGVYRARVTLEDPTARIHAYLYAEDAETFFEGYPPTDILMRKWNALLGIAGGNGDAAPRNPPWVVCCIKSYYLDENNVWGSRNFRIFDTTLKC
ncbi:hypothetical protein RND81_09G010200 [Saponaria officinalis]|uniref:Protection of telomeres protein 1 n=1 Tax=Saponaria officinalis TaxID=3572 RepID=A0AAW1IG04_SAPOF